MGFGYDIWKDASPIRKGPSTYVFLLKNQSSPFLPSQVTFLMHIIIFLLNTIYYLPEKSKG